MPPLYAMMSMPTRRIYCARLAHAAACFIFIRRRPAYCRESHDTPRALPLPMVCGCAACSRSRRVRCFVEVEMACQHDAVLNVFRCVRKAVMHIVDAAAWLRYTRLDVTMIAGVFVVLPVRHMRWLTANIAMRSSLHACFQRRRISAFFGNGA